MTETMTPEQYRAELAKPKPQSESAKTRALFLYQIRARNLPYPRNKDHADGEVRFASAETELPRQRRMKRKAAPRWAFDYAWEDRRIAVEVEGIVVMRDAATGHTRIGGRHGNVGGFNDDNEKYAWAAVLGWRLLRFTPQQVKRGFAIDMLARMFAASMPAPLLVSMDDVAAEALKPGPMVPADQWTPEELARVPLTPPKPFNTTRPRITDELHFGNAHEPPPF